MSYFRANAKAIFPFKVSGCAKMTAKASCNLEAMPAGILGTAGTVAVTTGKNSFQFTVTSNGYFDAAGSTIRFRTFESGGSTWLEQYGSAGNVTLASELAFYLGVVHGTWGTQANNLTCAMSSDVCMSRVMG